MFSPTRATRVPRSGHAATTAEWLWGAPQAALMMTLSREDLLMKAGAARAHAQAAWRLVVIA